MWLLHGERAHVVCPEQESLRGAVRLTSSLWQELLCPGEGLGTKPGADSVAWGVGRSGRYRFVVRFVGSENVFTMMSKETCVTPDDVAANQDLIVR